MRILKTSLAGLVLSATLAGGIALDAGHLGPTHHGQKPMFPVRAILELTGSPEPGGVASILASVTAWAPGEAVTWKLTVPQGLTLVHGPTTWSGILAKGETKSFELAVRVPDGAAYELFAEALLPERPNARSAASLPIDLGGFEGPRATERLVQGDGESYIQYQGEVTPRESGR